jgi:hypothetical protein
MSAAGPPLVNALYLLFVSVKNSIHDRVYQLEIPDEFPKKIFVDSRRGFRK